MYISDCIFSFICANLHLDMCVYSVCDVLAYISICSFCHSICISVHLSMCFPFRHCRRGADGAILLASWAAAKEHTK